MILFKEHRPLELYIEKLKHEGKKVGFVPTMGALHEGHLSLIQQSKKNNDITVCSIFVNPTQFNDVSDFQKYPITIQSDILALESCDTDILFLPSVGEMYPTGTELKEKYDLGFLETVLEGAHRPGHFQGVCQVVHRLLDIVQPHVLYLGQKDYQQCMVLQKLIEISNLSTHTEFAPTQREADGLAMSSRNTRLSAQGRQQATAIFRMLSAIRSQLSEVRSQRSEVRSQQIEEDGKNFLLANGFQKVDYVSICNADTLEHITNWNDQDRLVILTAAFIDGVRLIDNLLIN